MDTPRSRRTGFFLVLVLTLSFGAYAPSLLNGFTFDDAFYAKAEMRSGLPNPMVAELHPVTDYFRRPMNYGATYTRGFRPVTVYSYALVHHWSRDKLSSGVMGDEWSDPAWPQHLVNLVLHVLATALVFALARKLARDGPALIAALVFGVHAVHTEAVAWIVGRGEILAFVFGAGATLAYAAALGRQGRARAATLAAVAVMLFLGFCSKESGVAWAGFVPLFAAALAFRERPSADVLAQLRAQARPWFVAVGVPLVSFLVLRHRMLVEHVDPFGPFVIPFDHNPLFQLSFLERLPSALMLWGYGIYKALLPISLCVSYRSSVFDLPAGWLDLRALTAGAVVVAGLFVTIVSIRRRPLLCTAGAAFFGLSFITTNIPTPIETTFGERFYYAPILGLALLLAWLASRVTLRGVQLALAVPLAAWLALCTWKSVERCAEWRDDFSLFAADVHKQPDAVELHTNLAAQHFRNFGEEQGRAELEKALEIQPDSTQALIQMASHLLDRAAFFAKAKQQEQASAMFAEASSLLERVRTSPRYIEAVDERSVHVLLARYHQQQGREDEFFAHAEKALVCDPRDIRLRLSLMERAREIGDERRFQELLAGGERVRPYCSYLRMVRGDLAHEAGRHREAVRHYARSLPSLPQQTVVLESWHHYARSLIEIDRQDDAREIAKHCMQVHLPTDLLARFESLARSLDLAMPQR